MDSGRIRHAGDSLIIDPERREKFVAMLKKFRVKALLCGHTHNCSVAKVQGVWQTDSGHARGAGDLGAPSTFLKIRVNGDRASVDIYRADRNGQNYALRKSVEMN
jgi:predicted phosphodiesterase